MAFSPLTSGQCDADSPINEVLMQLIRTNFNDLDAARVTNGDSHDHSGGGGAAIPQGGLKTGTSLSLAGSIASASSVIIGLNAYSFFPMIHTSFNAVSLRGHIDDGNSPDEPRFSFYNPSGTSQTYDVDCRNVAA